MSEAMKEEITFQVGDRVEDTTIGAQCTLIQGHAKNIFETPWGIKDDRLPFNVCEHGHACESDKYPSIRLIDRPKKLVKKEAKVYLYKIELNHFRTLETYTKPPLEHDYDDERIPVIVTWEEES